MPAHEAQRDFPQTAEALAAYDAVILSDIGSNTLLLHPDTWIHSKRDAEPAARAEGLCRERRRPVDGGRLLQLPGHQRRRALSRHAGRGGAAGRYPALRRPGRGARRLHPGRSNRTVHPILAGFEANGRRCLVSTRSSRSRSADSSCDRVRGLWGKAAARRGDFGEGRTLAWTSDIGPHWLPPEFAAWPGYARLWRQSLEWLTGRARLRSMIHVVGNAAVDTILRVERFPQPGETIAALGSADDLGGKGANQAIMVARSGGRVRLVAAIGEDAEGERIRRALDAEGVGTDGLATGSGPTDRCVISVDARGENTVVSLIDAARAFDPVAAGDFASRIAEGDWVVMQGNLRADVTRACLALARASGATTDSQSVSALCAAGLRLAFGRPRHSQPGRGGGAWRERRSR